MADLKTLRVCLSRDLPASVDRDQNFLYLAYDKLSLYSGSSLIDENFVIANSIPLDPVPGMIYILDTDGSVHRNIDYSDKKIAEIEDAAQIDLLKKAGTIFYSNANNRYLDSQKRTLTLPFNNGTYELNISMMNDQVFNNNTILKFNEEHERFEIYGEHDEEFIDFSKPFRGGETSSAKMSVDNGRLKADIKISNAYDNLIKLASDGLYAKVSDKVSSNEYTTWKKEVDDFKSYAQNILDLISSEIKSLEELISPEELNRRSIEILEAKYSDIDQALQNYQAVVDSLNSISSNLLNYASTTIINATENLDDKLDENSSWNDLDDAASTYEHEVNYYAKAEKYFNTLPIRKLKLILSAAAIEYFS